MRAFYRPEVAAELDADGSMDRLRAELPAGFAGWSSLERAASLELTTLLEPYLLAAQGDRVAMASGVEGRYPFLDHRVFECSAALSPESKLQGMRDKIALRELAAEMLPPEVSARAKQPYRAPEVSPFFASDSPAWVEEMLSPSGLAETGVWDARRVSRLLERCREGRASGVREGMALVGILTTQLWHHEFISQGAGQSPAETAEPRVRIDRREDFNQEGR